MSDELSIRDNVSLSNTSAVNIASLNPEQLARIEDIKKQINVEDSQAIITYGVGAQRDISTFADNILQEVRTKDSGYAGNILSDLVLKVRDIDVDSLGSKEGFFAKIPFLGGLVNSFRKFIIRYEKLSVQIEKIIDELDKARMQMLRDLTLLDSMYGKNLEYLQNLDLFIAAGQLKLQELQNTVAPRLKMKADETKDPADAQKYNDFMQFLNRFEKKIYDLQLSRMISIQAGPQIRLIQNGDQALVEKIQSSILNTIPLWKNQIVIAITLFRQKSALKLQKEVTDTTNELLRKNSEMLKESSVEIAKESERGIVDIETLKKVNSDLISTIEDTLKIQADGKAKRQLAESELAKIEQELKDKLLSVRV
ncbi:MAG: toxic anion resistance protein [Bacteroidota bacterium]